MRISDWSSDVCSSDRIPLPGRDATSPLPPPTPMTTPLLEQLIEAFRVLPGVGQKTAQRMAYHVLERERDGGRRLADALAESRSEERRVGKECVRTCMFRWSPCH